MVLGLHVQRSTDPDTGRPVEQFNQLSAMIRKSLYSIHSATVLCAMGLDVDPTGSMTDLLQAKHKYLNSPNFKRQAWAGSLEMFLISYLFEGDTVFLTLDNTTSPLKRFDAFSMEFNSLGLSPLARPKPSEREIVLHHCSYKGQNPHELNHYNLVTFRTSSRTGSGDHLLWPHLLTESPEMRQARDQLTLQATRQAELTTRARLRIATAAAGKLVADMLRAEKRIVSSLGDVGHSLKPVAAAPVTVTAPVQPKSTKPAIDHSTRPHSKVPSSARRNLSFDSHQSSAVKSPAQVPPTVTDASTHTPARQRLHVWRELPSSCHAAFRNVTGGMMKAYGKLSTAGNYERCAELLHTFLNVPSQLLLKAGPIQQLKQALERGTELLKPYIDVLDHTPCADPTADLNTPPIDITTAPDTGTAPVTHCHNTGDDQQTPAPDQPDGWIHNRRIRL